MKGIGIVWAAVTLASFILTASVWAQPSQRKSVVRPVPVAAKEEKVAAIEPGQDDLWHKTKEERESARSKVLSLLKGPLTVNGAIQIALLNNRKLQTTFEEVGVARAELLEAVMIPNPRVNFDALIQSPSDEAVKYSWNVAQDFVQILMIPLKKKIAEERIRIAELRVSLEILELIEQVKKAYYQVQADQQLLARLALIQETNAAALDLAQKQYKAGNVTDLRLMTMQSAYSQGRLDLAVAENELREHREDLTRLMGLWGREINWTIKGDLPVPPDSDPVMNHLESLAVSNRPDLQVAHRNLSAVVEALGLTKTYRWIPVLEIGFSGERETDNALLLGPSISFELPIFNQGRPRIAKGEAELRKAENQFEALAVEIRSEVRTLRDKLIGSKKIARFYHDDLLPARLKIVNQALLEYNAMQLGAFELFTLKASELEAERGYIQASQNYWMTRASLERAVGGSLYRVPHKQGPAEKSTPSRAVSTDRMSQKITPKHRSKQ
ncbi:MAG: TolC family protein [Candidatus Methylacidiphilales bacterium]